MQIAGSHFFITGAARRIGKHLAVHFGKQGAKVSCHYFRSEKQAAQTRKELEVLGVQCQIVQGDLRSPRDVESVVYQTVTNLGPVGVLVHCASAFYENSIENCSLVQWDEMMQTNARAAHFLVQKFVVSEKALSEQASIIYVTDAKASRAYPRGAAYGASKAALISLTRSLAKELAPNVRVNAVSPGTVLFSESFTSQRRDQAIADSLFKRIGTPADVCWATQLLIENEYITGTELVVDGGRSLVYG